MKIICASVNSKYIHSSLSCWCLKAGVEKFCNNTHSVQIAECTINSDIEEFYSKLISSDADLIAFSCYIWNFEIIIELCKKIRQNSDIKIVLGGPEVAFRSTEILREYCFIDFILGGEGEWSFSSLINSLENDLDLSLCESLTYKKEGVIYSNPDTPHIETPPSPYCSDYFNTLSGRICYIEASRGCPFRCSFCLSGRISGLRFFDFEQIKEDIVKLSHSGTKTVKFIDRTFNADYKIANKILTFIRDNYGSVIKEGVCFHFEIDGSIIHNSTMEILNTMPENAIQLEIGIQSFNKNTLNSISRKSDTDKLCTNIRKLLSFNNIHIHIDLIAGLPYEDYLSFKDSFNKAYYLNAHMLQLGFLKFLHGTRMRSEAEAHNSVFSKNPPYEIISNKYISDAEINKIKLCEKALDKMYNSGRFLLTVEYLLSATKLAPFDLYKKFGDYSGSDNTSLSQTVADLYDCFSLICNKEILKEKILCDIASTKANIHIPDILTVYSPLYKKTKKQYVELFKDNVKIVILNSCNKVYVVPSSQKPDLSGRLNGFYYDL